MRPWLVKVKRYMGGESIVNSFDFELDAQEYVDQMNNEYQTDSYFVEQYDQAKLTGWS